MVNGRISDFTCPAILSVTNGGVVRSSCPGLRSFQARAQLFQKSCSRAWQSARPKRPSRRRCTGDGQGAPELGPMGPWARSEKAGFKPMGPLPGSLAMCALFRGDGCLSMPGARKTAHCGNRFGQATNSLRIAMSPAMKLLTEGWGSFFDPEVSLLWVPAP